jgi:hypothetical protein
MRQQKPCRRSQKIAAGDLIVLSVDESKGADDPLKLALRRFM